MSDFGEALGRILVIIPTYNEAENIQMITSRLRTAVPEADILITDDNSPDGTGDIADRIALDDGHVHVLHRAAKEGLGAAYVEGFRWGLNRGYDVLVEHDADGSHQPEELPRLLQRLQTADMVKGSRWVKGGSVVNWDKKRELLSRAANIWVQAAMDIPVRDSTGGFNAFRSDILRKIDLGEVSSRGYTFQVDMTRRVLEAGGTVAEVPIQFMERVHGESKMSGSIIGEAIVKTAKWGARRRGEQLKQLFEMAKSKAVELTEQADLATRPRDEEPSTAKRAQASRKKDAGTKINKEATGMSEMQKNQPVEDPDRVVIDPDKADQVEPEDTAPRYSAEKSAGTLEGADPDLDPDA